MCPMFTDSTPPPSPPPPFESLALPQCMTSKRNVDINVNVNLNANLNICKALVTNKTYPRNIKVKSYMPHCCLRQTGNKKYGMKCGIFRTFTILLHNKVLLGQFQWVPTSHVFITKTSPFKYTENFTTKNWKFSDKNSEFFIFLLKT